MNLTFNQKQLIYWITERESIRKKKEANLPAPWSDNPVMQTVYFCNVNREDDKVTKWIRDNWFDNEDGYYELAIITARTFNSPSILSDFGQPDAENINDWLDNLLPTIEVRKSKNLGVWGGAYMVATGGKKVDKGEFCVNNIKKVANDLHKMHNVTSLRSMHKVLMSFDGIGEFLSAQIIADLKNTPNHKLYQANDWSTFSSPGPGSLRGLSWFFETSVTRSKYQEKIKEAYNILEFELEEDILNFLCFQNLQNCFCEYDKFMRVSEGIFRSKRNYNGKGE
jgi:hypothetical protein